MNNVYLDSIEKIATQAWKKHFAELGEESIKRLQNSGILDRSKELKGMRIGTKKILAKENAKMFRRPEKYIANTMESVKHSSGITPNMPEYSQTRQALKDIGVSGNGSVAHPKWNRTAASFVPKNARKNLASTLERSNIELNGIPRNDRESKKWVQAILERHEADEIRHGRKVMNKPKFMVDYMGQKVPTTRFASHLTPRVVTSESSNVALAPSGAKKYMKELRSIGPSGNTEVDALKQYGNSFEYGKSPIFDKKRSLLLEKNMDNITRQWI